MSQSEGRVKGSFELAGVPFWDRGEPNERNSRGFVSDFKIRVSDMSSGFGRFSELSQAVCLLEHLQKIAGYLKSSGLSLRV